ncbi:transformer-2 protein homolog beta-like [Toxorhynchites rutilus septentrionalis]|uniref:transformer-2 protein homolog beta-like n=1 Tax=Toxorhynchites rutilus septentrionalis TaxID=329112 RepID=UPI002479A661|nr:transformer-2 protein homolog beta-like [Toxorhynchites rutilus septentrionalis]
MGQPRSSSRTPPRSYRKSNKTSSHHSRRRSRKHGRSSRRYRSISSRSTLSHSSISDCSSCVTPDRTRPVNPPPSTCLGVFGLSCYTRESDLMNIFSRYGAIDKVVVVYDAQTKASRGFGFVYFQDIEGASIAKAQCNGMMVHEKTIRVDYSITDRPHTPTPGMYMGNKDSRKRHHRTVHRYRGRSYDDDYYYKHSRRSPRRHSTRYRRHRRRNSSRSRSRSWSCSTSDSHRSYRCSRR